jgi:Ca2+-transporting ATPase
MERNPRNTDEKILTTSILAKSLVQGFIVFTASFGTYFTFLQQDPGNAALARTMGLSIIIIANLFLVQVNSSNYEYAIKSIRRLYKDNVMWAASIGTFAGLLLMMYTPLRVILNLAPLSFTQFITAILVAAASVFWYEIVKLVECYQVAPSFRRM